MYLRAVNGAPSKQAADLMEEPKKSRVSKAERPAMTVVVKTLDREQTMSEGQKAVRLFCRGMIRLYLQDNSKTQNGISLGIL